MLLYAQDEIGAVTQELIEEVARRCGVTPLQVDEVIGYYSMLHRKPLGKYHVQVCTNIACHAVGGEELYEHASRTLEARPQTSYRPTGRSLSKRSNASALAPGLLLFKSITIFITSSRRSSFDRLMEGLRNGNYRSGNDALITHLARSKSESCPRASILKTRRRSIPISPTTATSP